MANTLIIWADLKGTMLDIVNYRFFFRIVSKDVIKVLKSPEEGLVHI